MKKVLLLVAALLWSAVSHAQVSTGPPLLGYASAALPATCKLGQIWFNTAAASGSNLFGCTATNTWVAQAGGGGGGGSPGGASGSIQINSAGVFGGLANSSTVGQALRVTGAATYGFGAINLASSNAVTGILGEANGGTGITALGTGISAALGTNVGSAGAPVLFNGAGGTPSSLTLTSATGLPIAGVTGWGTGIAAALAINTGSAGSPVLFNGAGGTPTSLALTNATGLPLASVTGLGTGVPAALAINIGSAGAPVVLNGAGGTPSSITLTNASGYAQSALTGLGTGVSTSLGLAVSGTGGSVLTTSPTITTPTFSGAITFPANTRQTFAPGASASGLNLGSVASDPSAPSDGDLWYNSTTPGVRARVNGSTITLGAGGGGGTPGGSDTQVQYNNAGNFAGQAGFTFNGSSKITMGVAGSSVGSVDFKNATSGTITLAPTTGALGTVTLTMPASTGTLALVSGALGTPTSLTLTNATGLPIAGTTGYGTGVATLLGQTSSGTGGLAGVTSPTIATPTFTGAITFPSNQRQTFVPGAGSPGLNVGSVASDPSSPSNGDIWYNSGTPGLRARVNGATITLGSGGGSGCVPAGSNNQILTDSGSGTCVSEGNMTFDGATLAITGDATISGSVTASNLTALSGSLTSGGVIWTDGTSVLSTVALTSNSVVLGGGTGVGPKTIAGITTDGTSKVTLGVAGTSVGSVDFKNATSGTITLAPTTGALGTITLTMPAVSGTLLQSGTAVTVPQGGTGLTGGTSGGIPYYNSGTTLASSGVLGSNLLTLGAGAGSAPKTAAGLATNGTSQLQLGVAGSSVGSVQMANATSGTVTIQPTTGALGTVTLTAPAVSGTILQSGTAVTVPQGGTGLVSGTSGGVLYFSGTTTVASSGALTSNLPVIGGGAGGALASGTVTGNTTKFTTATGTPASGNCASWDASGNIQDAGSPCGGSGSTPANPTASVGTTVVNGVAVTFMRSDAAPPISQSIVPTWTGIHTFSPSARSSGAAPYFVITTPADTNQTASTEAIGVSKTAATRQWATGALTLQREVVLAAPTYSAVGSTTISTAIGLDVYAAIPGTNVSISNNFAAKFNGDTFTTGIIRAGSTPTVITDSAGKVLSAALNTVAVGQGGTGLTAGTSGGVTYFNSSSTLASSGALTANAVVLGGGAGAAPKVSTGITTDGASALSLGTAGSAVGSVSYANATSGSITVSPPTGALGTTTRTLQAVSGVEAVRIVAGTSALGTSAVSSGTCATTVTTTATGAAATDVLNWGFNSDPTGVTGYVPSTAGMLTIIAWPTSGNVNMKVCNNSSSSITPGAITLNWVIIR